MRFSCSAKRPWGQNKWLLLENSRHFSALKWLFTIVKCLLLAVKCLLISVKRLLISVKRLLISVKRLFMTRKQTFRIGRKNTFQPNALIIRQIRFG